MNRNNFAGVPFIVSSHAEAVQMTLNLAKNPNAGADIHLLNAYSIALAQSTPSFKDCVKFSKYNFPDGKPVSWFSKRYGPQLSQVRGPQFFEDVLDAGRQHGIRHYFLGSSTETLALLKLKMEEKFEGLLVAGTHSPAFRPLSPEEIIEQDTLIRKSEPHIVWVGLGTPKQDYEVNRLASEGFVAAAVGAAFDFSAGTKKPSPKWISFLGLEWFHRLVSEPRRLWKRYFWGNAVFLKTVILGVGLSRE